MQTEWKANTGKWALLVRSVSTVLLARRISKSVKKLARELEESKVDEEDAKVQWLDLHRRNAKLTHQHILKYRGFLIKVGQAASIKAGDLPAPWAEELRGLQDELPVSPFKEVKRTVRVDLGKPLDQIFHHFEQRPIASASVAQAHIAWLRNDNRKVCVKVQHRGVASMMSTDLATVNFIVSRMPKHHPDSPDFSDLIKEWRRASREEVDFRLEARNALQALHALRKAKLNVTCPEPIAACCGRRVLTMAYINGWKITDVDHLPFGTDREALVRPLVDAFAMLAFEEGLIHGDPHPGNVFVEPVEDPSSGSGSGAGAGLGAGGSSSSSSKPKPKQVRAALLDWGIVQRMSEKERAAAARWAVASLAQDRVMYLQALLDLGFAFDMDFDSSDFASFLEAFMGHSAWLLRDSIPISSQQNFLEKWREHQENAEQQKMRTGYREPTRAVSKIGGVIYFFLRGLEMLQNICSALEVTLPFASVILHRAMPLIQGSSKGVLRALPAPSNCSELEQAVRARLQELEDEGSILGAQVAVLRGDAGAPGQWLCRVSVGRSSVTGGPVTDSTMMPLLDTSVGVLVLCLLAAMAHPTVTGRTVGLDTPASQLWPDFAQRDKGRFTIGQVLQHRAGLQRVFPMEMSLKAFCNEQRMEQLLSALPREHPSEAACRVVGNVAAALLRRAIGRRSAAEAVKAILEPLGLHDQIAYRGLDKRMAFVGKKPRDGLPMEELWEWLEEKVDMMEAQADRKASWLTWRELASEKPGYTDPMLVNREVLRNGECCLPGRGLRANAEAICRLYASKLLPDELLERSRTLARQLHPKTWDESSEMGHCLDLGEGGWQLFRFQSLEEGETVVAHGYVDGSTGSVTLRLPQASVAVLLNSADKRTRHVGHELLTSIARHFGLKPAWDPQALKLPEKGRTMKLAEDVAGAPADGELPEEVQCTITKMKAKVARLTEALAAAGVTLDDEEEEEEQEEEEEPPKTLAGSWKSAETEGLQALLEAFDVPAMVRTFAQTARRNLSIKVDGDQVHLHTNTCFMGRQVEETSNQFTVGKAFEGQQELGGAFTGLAKWTQTTTEGEGDETEKGQASCHLTVEKRFVVSGREVVVVERFLLSADGRLALTTILRSGGEQEFEVCSAEELQHICSKLDPETLRLRSELQLGSEYLARSGRIAGKEAGLPVETLCSLTVPRTLTFKYDDLESTTMFDRVENRSARPKSRSKVGPGRVRQSRIGDASSPINVTPPFSNLSDLVPAGSGHVTDCAMGVAAVGWAAATLASSALQALGRALDNMCVNHQVEALGKGKARSPQALCDDAEVRPLLCLEDDSVESPECGGSKLLEDITAEPEPDTEAQSPDYMITLDRCNGLPLGIGMDECTTEARRDSSLPCVSSLNRTLVGQWNLDHPELQVRVGDRVVEVNGIRGDAFELMQECSKMQIMQIRLRRHSVWRCCWSGGIRIRAVPDVHGDLVGETVAHNEIVLVSEEHRGPDGILYLRLVDRRGWLFEHKPDLGTVCVRHTAVKSSGTLEETPETKSHTSRASDEESLHRSLSPPTGAPVENLRALAAPWTDMAGTHSRCVATGEHVEASQLPGQRALGLQEKVLDPLPLCTKAASSSPRLPTRPSPSSQTVWEPAMEPSTPSVGSKAPVKFEEDPIFEFSVVLRRTSSSSLGLRADPTDGGSKLMVHAIAEGGLLARWNASCSVGRRVHIGDRIVSINGCRGDARLLVEELCRAGQTLNMRLERNESSCSSVETSMQEDLDRCPHPPCSAAEPKPAVIFMLDPRRGQACDVAVLAFCGQGREGPWDILCGADFLGGHFNAGPFGLQLEAPCDSGRRWNFGNSEAAFQALRFWLLAGEFSPLSASAALKKSARLRGHEDPTYAGFGSSWRGMLAVLRAKFAPGSALAKALVKTQDAFLLNHWTVEGEEDLWSDNGLGGGRNWLGAQLMLLRDELSGQGLWTNHLGGLLDLDTGKARGPEAAGKWQDTVHRAAMALADAVHLLREARPNSVPSDFRTQGPADHGQQAQ